MFGERSLAALSVEEVRDFVAELAEAVEAGDMAAKTVNNALGTLVVCLNDAVEDGLIASNPALRVERLPAAHIEREYVRLDEIPAVPRRVLGRLPPAGRAAHWTRAADLEALGLRLLAVGRPGRPGRAEARHRPTDRRKRVSASVP